MCVALQKTAGKVEISRLSGFSTWNMEAVQGLKLHFHEAFFNDFLIYFEGFGMAETLGIEIILKTVNLAMKSVWTLLAATPVYCLRYRDLAKATILGGDMIQSPKVANNSFTEDA